MTDVVISGGGPNGLMLACELAVAGVRPVVLEKLAERDPMPKANGLVGRVVQALDQRGLLDAFRAEAPFCGPVPRFQFGAMPLELTRLGADNPILTMPIPQRTVERLLEARARELGVEIRRGHELTGFTQDELGVDVQVHGPDGDHRLRTRYLVGCDGGRSRVRKLAGIGFPGHTNEFAVGRSGRVVVPEELVVPGTGELDVPGFGRLAPAVFVRTETGMIASASFEPGVHLIFAWEADGGPVDQTAPMTLDELRAAAARVLGVPLPMVRLADERSLRRNTGQNTRQADAYRSGRVLLVGDSAHVHSGIGGPGLNLGLQDAINLGWKLAAEVRGWAPAGLLDSYHGERHPVGTRVMMSSLSQSALFAPGPEVTALRALVGELLTDDTTLRRIAELMAGADVRYEMPFADPHPLLGRWMPDLALTTVDGPARVAELARPAGALLLDLTGTVRLPGDWGDRVRVVRAEHPDPPADAVLVRPDGYVAWAGGAGLTEALHTWFGAPLPTPAGAIHQS